MHEPDEVRLWRAFYDEVELLLNLRRVRTIGFVVPGKEDKLIPIFKLKFCYETKHCFSECTDHIKYIWYVAVPGLDV